MSMIVVLFILALLSLGGGLLNANGAFEHWLYPHGLAAIPPINHEAEGLPLPLWMLSSIAALGGILFGAMSYMKGLPKNQGDDPRKWAGWRRFAANQFGFDQFATEMAVAGGDEIGRAANRWFEHGFIDLVVNGVGVASAAIGSSLKQLQTGYVRMYAFVMLAGGFAFIGYFIYILSTLGGSR